MSLYSKLKSIIDTKNNIKTAIQNKGVTVLDTDTFRSYANKITNIDVSDFSRAANLLYDMTDMFSSVPQDASDEVLNSILYLCYLSKDKTKTLKNIGLSEPICNRCLLLDNWYLCNIVKGWTTGWEDSTEKDITIRVLDSSDNPLNNISVKVYGLNSDYSDYFTNDNSIPAMDLLNYIIEDKMVPAAAGVTDSDGLTSMYVEDPLLYLVVVNESNNGYQTYAIAYVPYTAFNNTLTIRLQESNGEEVKEAWNYNTWLSRRNGIYTKLYDTDNDNIGDALVFSDSPIFNYTGKLIEDYTHKDLTNTLYMTLPYNEVATNIKTIDILNEIKPENLNSWFKGMTNLTQIKNISNINTNQTKSFYNLFYSCESLTSIDISNWKMLEPENMSYMFYSCKNLTELILPTNLDTSFVTTMKYMFGDCNNLLSLDISTFSYLNVLDCDNMFTRCNSLVELNIGDFNPTNISYLNGIFTRCNSLKTVTGTLDLHSMTSISLSLPDSKLLETIFIKLPQVKTFTDLITCTNLSKESILFLINNLLDVSSSTETHRVSLGRTNLAKLTDAEIAIATSKGWTLS